MKSSTGQHFIGLDHVRAIAAFMVVAWHFNHAWLGTPVPFGSPPVIFPLALIDQGHTGVALFMVLSGYLFAKLLDGKQIRFGAFLWNRALRLLPLLALVCAMNLLLAAHHGQNILPQLRNIALGVVLPTLPSGGWSITVEWHFYLILPLFLWLVRKSKFLPLLLVAAALSFRALYFLWTGEVQSLAYWTIVGRLDQFAFGMIMFQCRGALRGRHWWVGAVLVAFSLFYWVVDKSVGPLNLTTEAVGGALWIVLPTIEGLVYAVVIAWYDTSFEPKNSGVSRWLALAGSYSYSIYLLHFFFVFRAAQWVDSRVMDISNFYLATLWAAAFFAAMVPLGYLSYRFIEAPFLRFRRRYTVGESRLAADPSPRLAVIAP